MDPERWTQVDKLLQSALELPVAECEPLLQRACGGDGQLESELRSLLAAHDGADSFLAAPAIDRAARELAEERVDDGSHAGPSTPLRAGHSTSLRSSGDPLIGQTFSHYRIVEKLGGGPLDSLRSCR